MARARRDHRGRRHYPCDLRRCRDRPGGAEEAASICEQICSLKWSWSTTRRKSPKNSASNCAASWSAISSCATPSCLTIRRRRIERFVVPQEIPVRHAGDEIADVAMIPAGCREVFEEPIEARDRVPAVLIQYRG